MFNPEQDIESNKSITAKSNCSTKTYPEIQKPESTVKNPEAQKLGTQTRNINLTI